MCAVRVTLRRFRNERTRRDPADSPAFAPGAAIRRPKILFLISTLAGGIGTSLKALVPFLTARYDVRVCEFLPGDPALKKSIAGLDIEIEEIDRPGTDVRIAKDIFNTLNRFQPDLIQGFELETNFYACLLSRRPKIVATFHGMVSAFRWTHSLFLQTIFLAADAVACVSEALRQRCLRFALCMRPPCSVIRNGVDIARFSPAPRPGRSAKPFILGYVANFYSSVKGHRYLLEAVAALPCRGNFKLWLVGDGALLAEMMRMARELDIDRQVVFLGPRDDVPALLSQMDAFVLPSLTEGCPHALLEAMASGLPVIATSVGGVPEIVTDNETGILVPPSDPDAIRDAVLRLMDDDSLADLLRRNARALVESAFTDRLAAAAYLSLYDDLLGRQP
jgi:glycosyltransferase involved in cell wall biosynthesis